MIKNIIKYHFLSFTRFKMTYFKAPPDFIAILLSLLTLSIVTIGLASENPLIFNEEKLLNYNYTVFSVYLISFFFEGYLNNHYAPNYKYLKLVLPTNLKKQLFIDFLFEFLSYKLFLLLPYIFSFYIFKETYSLDFNLFIALKGLFFIMISYINACLLMQFIKCNMKEKAFNFHKNFFKLFFFILIVIATLNKNLKFINLNTMEAMNILFFSSFLITFLLVFLIVKTTLNQDKI